jgi:phenylacetate-CoA ligase
MKRVAFELKSMVAARSSRRWLAEFLAQDRLEPADLRRLGEKRAVAHARFAMEHSRFYREFYSDHGVRLGELRDIAAFEALPMVDKQVLRENLEGIRTDEWTPANSAISKTGGSTGLPLHVYRDLRFPARALEWRLFSWWGVDPWDDRAIVMRHMREGRDRLRHALQWWPSRRIQLDAFDITDASVRAFVAEWHRLRPGFLIGYGGGVLEFARRAMSLGLVVEPPRAIAVTAAPLAPGVRAEIEEILKAPCYDHYRTAEIPWIGGECEQRDGLHVFADVRRVEVLDAELRPAVAGQEGEVVVTDLTNRVFPVIRYRLGDVSSYREGECRCGRSLPRLGPISGRSSDMVRLPDGTTIAGALGHIFDHAPLSVRQFEIVQAADYSVTLRCIPANRPDAPAGIREAETKLRMMLRGLVPVSLEEVDQIPQVGGKMRFIRSHVVVTQPPR